MHWRKMKQQAEEVDVCLVGGVGTKTDISEAAQTS